MFPPYAHSNATSLRRRSDSTNPDALFDVPADLLAFYDKVGTKGSLDCGDGSGLDKRSGGYKTNGKGADGTRYCGDKAESPTYVWWVSNMDVDCDGAPDGTSGICQGDGSYFGETAFADESGKPIDAMKVQYVVIDQDDDFDPTKFGVQPLSAVAVICGSGGQMTFGVWADTNAIGSMGEASVTLARVCFGDSINGNSGHDEADVLYIAFPGSKDDTVPKGLGSDESALFDMGNKLVSGLFGGDSAGSSSGDGGGSTAGGGEKSSTGAASATSAGGVVDGATKGGGGQATTKAVSTSKPGSSSTSSPSSDSTSTAMPDGSGEGGSQDFFSNSTLLILLAIGLLISGLFSWWCISRRHAISYSSPHADRPGKRRRRRRPSTSSSSSSDGASGSSSDSDDDSEKDTSSGNSSEEEKHRLYQRGRGRHR